MPEQLLQVLSTDGKASRRTSGSLTEAELLRFYEAMVLTRVLDERCMLLQRQGRFGFYLPSSGEEALQIGSAAAYQPSDWVFPSYRVPGIFLWRGVPLDEMVCNLFGNSGDLVKGRQMPVHYSFRKFNMVSISSPIGTQIVQATGTAMAARIRGDRVIAATYFGDGGTSSSDFHTGMNFAAVFRAPVVFFCNNNGYAISCPYERQTASETIAIKARAYGMPGVRVDGNDVLAVYEATRQAVERARAGQGPTLIEAVTFRMGPHSSSDDPKRYVPKEQFEAWKDRDPIERFRRWLSQERILDASHDQGIHETARSRVADSVKRAEQIPSPHLASVFEDVYHDMPPHLLEQLRGLLEEEKAKGKFADTSVAFPL